MLRKGRNRIVISPGAEKAARNFCASKNMDLKEFIEEAIIEKIEYEETVDEMAGRGVAEDLRDEEPAEEDFKTRH